MTASRTLFFVLASSIALAGCGNQDSSTPAGTAAPTDSAPGQINSALPREDISTKLELVGSPTYDQADDSLHVHVRIINNGKTTLVSAGTAMVRLGAMLIGPQGPDQAPGNRDFVRIDLPSIPAGSNAEVEGKLPAAALVNLPVRFDLVQEGVNWFSAYGQPTLDVGPYKRCANNERSLCDSGDKPLPSG